MLSAFDIAQQNASASTKIKVAGAEEAVDHQKAEASPASQSPVPPPILSSAPKPISRPVLGSNGSEEKKDSEETILAQQKIDTICHELRGSLQGIYGNVSLFESSNEGLSKLFQTLDTQGTSPDFREKLVKCVARQKEAIHTIDFFARQQKIITDDILTLSKLKAGRLELNLSPIDPKKVIQDVLHNLHKAITTKKLNISLNFTSEEILINADLDRLKLIFQNLLSHVVRSAPERGEITITYAKPQKEEANILLKFSIKGNGLGVTEEKRSQNFSPDLHENILPAGINADFGLGLSISKKLIELMHGDIRIESEEAEESKIFFSIRCPNIYKPRVAPSSPLALSMQGPPINKSKCILIVEDNKINQMLLKSNLIQNGFSCMIANNGQEAVDLFKENKFFAILMDIEMPVLGGFEATKLIRQYEAATLSLDAPVPIIILSGTEPTLQFEETIFGIGANDYLTKPFDKESLLEKIARYSHQTPAVKVRSSASF